MREIHIHAGTVKVTAELNETRTAEAIWEALPLSASVNTWGDEIYFSIPVELEQQDARAIVAMGDLGYWPPGHAFCIFFGPTPASTGQEIRPASPVNVFGRVIGDAKILKQVRDGETITIEQAG